MYSLLVNGPEDVPGALAYFVYKQSKIEWRSAFVQDNAREPTRAEEEAFIRQASLPGNVLRFQRHGEYLLSTWGNTVLARKMAALVLEICQSELSGKLVSLQSSVDGGNRRIEMRLDERKSVAGWARDIGTSLMSGIGLILILGALLGGYKLLSQLNDTVRTTTGLRQGESALQSPPGAPTSRATPKGGVTVDER